MTKIKKKTKAKAKTLTIMAIKCPICLTTIYSRAHYDFHGCDCKDESDRIGITVDGGFDYMHYSWGNLIDRPEPFNIKVKATKQELYDDWNKRTDKYGWIRNEKK